MGFYASIHYTLTFVELIYFSRIAGLIVSVQYSATIIIHVNVSVCEHTHTTPFLQGMTLKSSLGITYENWEGIHVQIHNIIIHT